MTAAGEALVFHQDGDEIYNQLTHDVCKALNDDRLHKAALESPKVAVDLACGAGLWTVDFAQAYPSCQVIGIDLEPNPRPSDPPNCSFLAGDAQKDWHKIPQQPVDFIHIAGLSGLVESWSEVIQKAISCLAPGGWLELVDTGMKSESDDDSLDKADGLRRFDTLFEDALKKMGTDFPPTETLVAMMQAAGFQKVSVVVHKAPFSDWSREPAMKRVATLTSKLYEMDTEIIVKRCLRPVLNLSQGESEAVLADAIRDMRDTSVHGYKPIYFVSGQKPL